LGLLCGTIIFPPLGIVLGPFAGAFIGEHAGGNPAKKAVKTAWSSFLGSISGTTVKPCVTITLAYYFMAGIFTV
jgi:uncharacterized protein